LFTVTVKTDSSELKTSFSEKILISDALSALGIFISHPCGKKGTCKKCKVIANGYEVLACKTFISEDTYIDYTTQTREIQGVTDGFMAKFNKKPLILDGYGMAIDIGTTTLAGYIYKFPECECVKQSSIPNSQSCFGADVISRIEHSEEHLSELKKLVSDDIKKLSDGFSIDKYVICGNTTMLHLLTGLDPSGIARAPYTPKTLFGEWYENAYLARCMSSYVGADITCATIASGMTEDSTSFLVDIGTNGEMALWHKGKLICTSTAAGPAFEGAGIEAGMGAAPGAINKVYIEKGEVKYETIGNEKAVGICGSGIIDAVACMLKLHIIDETGFMEDDFEISDSGIFITQNDIREIQLAKSAIRSGIDTLLHECSINYDEIEAFYIAGGFGSYIDRQSTAAIGLIPNEVLPKAKVIGNGAGTGASMILQSKEILEKSVKLSKSAEVIELSTNAYFTEKYIENMSF